jgi:hypothetical protein
MDKSKNHSNLQNKQPEFFNYAYSITMRTFNWLLLSYIIFSFILFLFYFFLNENIIQKKWFDEHFIMRNSYYSSLICLMVAFSTLSLYKKSIAIYILYIAVSIFINFALIFNKEKNNMHFALMWISLTITAANILNIIFYYFRSIGYFKDRLVGINIDSIVHEVRLRTDLMKINFNSFFISTGMYRIFPNLLFKKEDYYFMNKDKYVENDRLDESVSFYKKANYSDCNSGFNSKSTIDSEYEPLK